MKHFPSGFVTVTLIDHRSKNNVFLSRSSELPFPMTIHQNAIIVAFSVDFHLEVSSQVINLKHSFHIIRSFTIDGASQHLPV